MVVNGWYNASYVISCPNHVDMIGYPMMAGKAVLICRQNSHPFLDRTLILEQPVKIGRSVARARAAQNNGIFDCKVLSRNHALFWYTNGKFYLQDTKSSNGTFVNNQRLSKSGEESSPREVCSGDVVQFGVDVLESTQKVTHGCIVADLKLYLPDGKEAKASPSTTEVGGTGSVSTEDLYQLNQYVQEALQREQMLQTKLSSVQQMVLSLRLASDVGWRALIAEDRLLSRVEILENLLQTYSKNFPEDKLREELRKLHDDKNIYQSTAKERLKKIYEEKLETVQKCQEVERVLLNTETECANFKLMMEKSNGELQELALKHTNQVLKTEELHNKLLKAEDQNKDMLTRIETNNEVTESQIQRRLENESLLEERIRELESTNEIAQRQILSLQFQNQTLKDQSNQTGLNNHLSNNVPSPKERGDIFSERIESKVEESRDISSMIDVLFLRLADSFDEQRKAKEVSDLIAAQIDLLQSEKLSVLQRINSLGNDLEVRSNELTHYRDTIEDLEQRIRVCEQRLEAEMKMTLSAEINSIPDTPQVNGDDRTISRNGGNSVIHSSTADNLNAQIKDLKELLADSRTKTEQAESKAKRLQMELDMSEDALNKVTESLILQEEKLKEAKKNSEEQEDIVKQLGEHMKRLQTCFKMRFHGKLDIDHESTNKQLEEIQLLRKQLVEAQQTAKQNKNESEQLKEKIRCLTLAIESADNMESNSSQDNKTIEELAAARSECSALKASVILLEAQIKKFKSDNAYCQNNVEESRTEASAEVENRQEAKSLEVLQAKVSELGEELVLVKEHYVACNEEKTRLEKEVEVLKQDYQAVTHQSYFNIVFILPLVVLFLALTVAFYPTLSVVLGTRDTTLPQP